MCSCLGFRRWSPSGKQSLRAPPGGQLVEDPVAVFCVDGRGRGFKHRLARKEVRMTGGWASGTTEEGLLSGSCSLPPCRPATAHRWLFPLVSGEGREGGKGCRGCPFGVKPGESASVRKGIWRAWWKPPCYLARAQTGASRVSLPTCDHSQSALQCSLTLRQQLVVCVSSLVPLSHQWSPWRPGFESLCVGPWELHSDDWQLLLVLVVLEYCLPLAESGKKSDWDSVPAAPPVSVPPAKPLENSAYPVDAWWRTVSAGERVHIPPIGNGPHTHLSHHVALLHGKTPEMAFQTTVYRSATDTWSSALLSCFAPVVLLWGFAALGGEDCGCPLAKAGIQEARMG